MERHHWSRQIDVFQKSTFWRSANLESTSKRGAGWMGFGGLLLKYFACADQGCQILLVQTLQNGKIYTKWPQNIPNDHKIYQMYKNYTKRPQNIPNVQKLYQTTIMYTKWLLNIPNGHKIYLHFPFQGPPKLTQIGTFGLKINHLATLVQILYKFWYIE
jgi:uncharacterized protein YpbB